MSQDLFERWHAGKYFDDDAFHPKQWVEKIMFSELDSESVKLVKLLEENNSWEAYCRLNSWLNALNKFVTYYNGEVGTHRPDAEIQGPMVKFLRWIGDNRTLIARIMAGIGAEYYSFTASPTGILLTVSFRSGSHVDVGPTSEEGISKGIPQPSDHAQPTITGAVPKSSVATSGGAFVGIRPLTFSPNDIRSNALNPNNAAHTASQINRANQMNPNSRTYRSSRKGGSR